MIRTKAFAVTRPMPNLWYGKVPDTYDAESRTAVLCSYFVNEVNHTVRCDSFARLSLPI